MERRERSPGAGAAAPVDYGPTAGAFHRLSKLINLKMDHGMVVRSLVVSSSWEICFPRRRTGSPPQNLILLS